MQRRYLYLTGGLAVIAAAALIADRTTQVRKYVLPNHISTDGKMMLPNGWRITPAGRHIKLPGDLPMKMIVTSDGKLIVNTAGWHDHNVNVIDIKTEKLEQSFDIGKNWDGMSLDPASGTVFISAGGTPRKGFEEGAATLKHKIAPEVIALVGKPVLRMQYEGGRLALGAPIAIEGVHPDNYFISGVTAKAGALYVLEINANKIFRLTGPNYDRQTIGDTGPRPYSAELSPDGAEENARTVDVQINRLRQKIEEDPSNPVYLQTVRGAGYTLHID